jgi:hypothetical protein
MMMMMWAKQSLGCVWNERFYAPDESNIIPQSNAVLSGDEPGCKGLQQFSAVYAALSLSSNHPIKQYAALCVHYNTATT